MAHGAKNDDSGGALQEIDMVFDKTEHIPAYFDDSIFLL